MNILGVGPLELILVLLVVLLVLGPKDLVKAGNKLGQFLNTVMKSEIWDSVTRVNKTVRDLPATLMREAELEDIKNEFDLNTKQLKSMSNDFQLSDLNKFVAENKANKERALRQIDPLSVVGSSGTFN